MSTRLTKTLQSHILENMRKQFEDGHDNEENRIANLIYEEYHNKYKTVLDQLPEGVAVYTRDLHIWAFDEHLRTKCIRFQMKESRKCFIYSHYPKVEIDSPLGNELKKYWQWYNDQAHTWDIIEKTMNELFASVNTVKQLLEVWPDGIKYLPQDVLQPKKVINPLAVSYNVDTLNTLMGIK